MGVPQVILHAPKHFLYLKLIAGLAKFNLETQIQMDLFKYLIVENAVFPFTEIQVLIELNEINHASNVGFIDALYCFDDIVAHFNVFFLTDAFYERNDFIPRQLIETNTNEFIL